MAASAHDRSAEAMIVNALTTKELVEELSHMAPTLHWSVDEDAEGMSGHPSNSSFLINETRTRKPSYRIVTHTLVLRPDKHFAYTYGFFDEDPKTSQRAEKRFLARGAWEETGDGLTQLKGEGKLLGGELTMTKKKESETEVRLCWQVPCPFPAPSLLAALAPPSRPMSHPRLPSSSHMAWHALSRQKPSPRPQHLTDSRSRLSTPSRAGEIEKCRPEGGHAASLRASKYGCTRNSPPRVRLSGRGM